MTDRDLEVDEDLVALAADAASRFAETAAAAAAAEAAQEARRRPVPAMADAPRRRLRSEDDHAADGRRVVQYPSALFPSAPVFRLQLPAGWEARPVPDAELAVRRPASIDGVVADVTVRVRRTVPPGASDDVRTVLALDGSSAAGSATGDVVVTDDVAADVATPVRRVLRRVVGSDGVPSVVRDLIVLVPATELVAHVVAVTANWPAVASDATVAEVEAVVDSLRLFMPRDGTTDGSAAPGTAAG